MSLPGADDPSAVVKHYAAESLTAQIGNAIARAGIADEHDRLAWKDLAPLDEFHVGGLSATEELAGKLQPTPGTTILDIGSGLGGPSRFLAATYDARVTGIDLNPPFVEAATMLSERTGLADRTTFRVADALNLPFDDSSFDDAWTQHVAMNIHDRARLYSEIFRVLRPGGLFAIHDIIQIGDQPLIFPVPWARGPETSFLLSADGMREILTRTGFEVVSWDDATEAGMTWISNVQSARAAMSEAPALGLHVVTSPDFPVMLANLGRNVREGRAGLVQAIVRSPGK